VGVRCIQPHGVATRQRSRSFYGDSKPAPVSDRGSLGFIIAPGDVLCARSTDRLKAVGTVGGYLGHVMLVVSPVRVIQWGAPGSEEFAEVLPDSNDWPLWSVQTVESTRDNEGLHEAQVLLHVEERTGQLFGLGEVDEANGFAAYDRQPVEVWQAPQELRAQFDAKLMQEVLDEMKKREASWSLATAARAVVASAWVAERGDPSTLVREVQQCWRARPICTSVVIGFWQRYLCRLSKKHDTAVSSADLILKWMPVKADRTLPGELLSSLLKSGWVLLPRVPKVCVRFYTQ